MPNNYYKPKSRKLTPVEAVTLVVCLMLVGVVTWIMWEALRT